MKIIRIADGSATRPSAETVGAKAANLAHIAALGVPVPPAFVLPVRLCTAVINGERQAGDRVAEGLEQGIAFLEQATGRKFGDSRCPLLVSVRSGAARSMPGMLETVLNVGCSPAAVQGLLRRTGNPRFAWDCRRRFLESFGSVVLGIDAAVFARARGEIAADEDVREDALDSEASERLARRYRDMIAAEEGALPEEPMEQLMAAAQAVYRSWMSNRAQTYRKLQHLEALAGTAVTVQAMVYGNRSSNSGAGVAFSRDPSTGAAAPVIDVLFESQGEDVVSGSRTPENEQAIVRRLPRVATQLRETLMALEREFADVQDVEFTIEDGQLHILQTRAAKRTPLAALRFAVDLVREGRIEPPQALRLLQDIDLAALTRTRLASTAEAAARGIAASAGIAVGRAAFESARATRLAEAGDPVILMRPDTSTADVAGFSAAAGIVTAIGGRTAHAALVARQMGKPCIVGCAALKVREAAREADLGGDVIREGDWLSIDGEAGTIFRGRLETVVERPEAELAEVASWRQQHHAA